MEIVCLMSAILHLHPSSPNSVAALTEFGVQAATLSSKTSLVSQRSGGEPLKIARSKKTLVGWKRGVNPPSRSVVNHHWVVFSSGPR
jgi:hypothetical protein